MNSKKDLIMVQTRIPKKNHIALKKMSIEYGMSMNAIVNFAITQYLQQKDIPNQIQEVKEIVNTVSKLQRK